MRRASNAQKLKRDLWLSGRNYKGFTLILLWNPEEKQGTLGAGGWYPQKEAPRAQSRWRGRGRETQDCLQGPPHGVRFGWLQGLRREMTGTQPRAEWASAQVSCWRDYFYHSLRIRCGFSCREILIFLGSRLERTYFDLEPRIIIPLRIAKGRSDVRS